MALQVGHSWGIVTFAYSHDGQTLATGGDGVRLWDTASGQLKANPPVGYVRTLAFSPDSKTLATAGQDAIGAETVYTCRTRVLPSAGLEGTWRVRISAWARTSPNPA